jgi:hypothetical protein
MLVMWRGMEILAGAGIVILVREAHMVIHGEEQRAGQVLRDATTVERFVAFLTSSHFV